MDRDQSKNETSSHEPTTESTSQEYILPNHEGDLKLESNVSSRAVLGNEPIPKSPAPERPSLKSQGGQEPSAVMAIHHVINNEHEQTVVSLSPRPSSPVTMISEERSRGPASHGSEQQESSEQPPTSGRADNHDPRVQKLNGSSENSWPGGQVPQTRDPSVREPSSAAGQKRAGAEPRRPRAHLTAGQPLPDQGPHYSPYNNAPSITATIAPPSSSDGANVPPLAQMGTLLMPHVPDHPWNQHTRLAPIDNTTPAGLPPIPELLGRPPGNPWQSRPRYAFNGYLPHPDQSERVELQIGDGRPARFVRGPTRPLGPPMKPFDGPDTEEKAREQYRLVEWWRQADGSGGL